MKPNYGIDAPTLVRNFLCGGGLLFFIGLIFVHSDTLRQPCIWIGATWFLTGSVMVFGSKVGKLRVRDRILDSLALAGSERALDIGCGRGLLLIGLAKRLPNGKAVGIDLWQSVDQSGNSPNTTKANARIEGVEDRVEIESGDMRDLPFDTDSFDCVVSSWAIHNIPDTNGRCRAVQEAVRVLKPGGKIVIIDIHAPFVYAKKLDEMEMLDVDISRPSFMFVIPTRVVTATKG